MLKKLGFWVDSWLKNQGIIPPPISSEFPIPPVEQISYGMLLR